jgi:hypothetical protein
MENMKINKLTLMDVFSHGSFLSIKMPNFIITGIIHIIQKASISTTKGGGLAAIIRGANAGGGE